jgi:hypothetical protein
MKNTDVVKKMYELFAEGDTEKIKLIFDEKSKMEYDEWFS